MRSPSTGGRRSSPGQESQCSSNKKQRRALNTAWCNYKQKQQKKGLPLEARAEWTKTRIAQMTARAAKSTLRRTLLQQDQSDLLESHACEEVAGNSAPNIQGSKNSVAEDIRSQLTYLIPTPVEEGMAGRTNVLSYWEPCAGGLSVLCKIVDMHHERFDRFFISDIDPHLIALWIHVRDWGLAGLPSFQDFTKTEYNRYCKMSKDNTNEKGNALCGYFGFASCWNHIRFNNWNGDMGDRFDKIHRFRKALLYVRPYLRNPKVVILEKPIDITSTACNVPAIPADTTASTRRHFIMYVDPPYFRNDYDGNPFFKCWKGNKSMQSRFWSNMERFAREGHQVAVSEYHKPESCSRFESVWQKANRKTSQRIKRGARMDEKLFVSDS